MAKPLRLFVTVYQTEGTFTGRVFEDDDAHLAQVHETEPRASLTQAVNDVETWARMNRYGVDRVVSFYLLDASLP